VALDFGGFAKGYAVDCAIEALMSHGCAAGLVNAGGDLRVFGTRAEPIILRGPAGELTRIELANAALAVSDADSQRRPAEHQGYYIRAGALGNSQHDANNRGAARSKNAEPARRRSVSALGRCSPPRQPAAPALRRRRRPRSGCRRCVDQVRVALPSPTAGPGVESVRRDATVESIDPRPNPPPVVSNNLLRRRGCAHRLLFLDRLVGCTVIEYEAAACRLHN